MILTILIETIFLTWSWNLTQKPAKVKFHSINIIFADSSFSNNDDLFCRLQYVYVNCKTTLAMHKKIWFIFPRNCKCFWGISFEILWQTIEGNRWWIIPDYLEAFFGQVVVPKLIEGNYSILSAPGKASALLHLTFSFSFFSTFAKFL